MDNTFKDRLHGLINQEQIVLYYKGELIGGCDIIKEMQTSGELKKLLCQ